MFKKASRALKSFDLAFFKSQRSFTSQNSQSSLIALEKISESMKSNKEKTFQDLLILDKLNETTYSNTFRALNKETKSFYSYKTININDDSTSALNQIELLIKQHDPTSTQESSFINYDKSINKVQVLTEMQKTTLGDFSEFYLRDKGQFSQEIMTEYSWQLFELLYRVRALDAVCYDLSLQNIFIDYKENKLKLHDYSDLRYLSDFYSEFKSFQAPYYLDIVLHSLAKMTVPSVTMSSPQDARAYFRDNFPEFMNEFREIEDFASKIKNWLPYDQNSTANILFELELRKSQALPFSTGYNRFLAEKIKKAVTSEEESWKRIEKAISQSNSDINAHIIKLKASRDNWQGQAQYYKRIGEFEKACDYFAKGLNVAQDIERIEKFQADGFKQENLGFRRAQPKVSENHNTEEEPLNKNYLRKVYYSSAFLTLVFWYYWVKYQNDGLEMFQKNENRSTKEAAVGQKKQEVETKNTVKTEEHKKKEDSIKLVVFGIVALLASLSLTL